MFAPNPATFEAAYPLTQFPLDLTVASEADRASDDLARVVASFRQLDRGQVTADGVYHQTVARIHELCAAIVECEEAGLAQFEIKSALVTTRAIHRRSPFVARLQDWPRGYPGDFETIEYLCDSQNRATPGTIEHAIERYALNSAIAQQHRNKVAIQSQRILDACIAAPGGARVLSIACGGCRDMWQIASMLARLGGQFVLVDSDADALDFARRELGDLADSCTFVHGSVPRIIRHLTDLGPFDLVFAGGLFDYLPDRLGTLTIREISRWLLAEGGSFMFTNIRRGNPFRVWIEYLADWKLIERDEDGCRQICVDAGIDAQDVKTSLDPTGLTIMVETQHRG